MEKINTQRKSMRIFWSRESQNHVNNPKIDQIYNSYVSWYNSYYKPKENVTYSPIGKYLFREYIRKNGYKNAQPKKKKIEKDEKKKEKEPKLLDSNLNVFDSVLEQYEIVDNSWVVIIKNVNMFQRHEIKGNRICLFRGKYREDHYGVVDSLHFINYYQRVVPVFKDKTTNELAYFYPDQLLIKTEKDANFSVVLKDLLVANINPNNNEFIVWIKPKVSLYHEINRLSKIKEITSVTMVKIKNIQ